MQRLAGGGCTEAVLPPRVAVEGQKRDNLTDTNTNEIQSLMKIKIQFQKAGRGIVVIICSYISEIIVRLLRDNFAIILK